MDRICEILDDTFLKHIDIESYQRDGFIHVPAVLDENEVDRYHQAAIETADRLADRDNCDGHILNQFVNVWQEDAVMRELTLHPKLSAIAQTLAGVSLRLWHDHLLIKPPHNKAPTEFHQDQPYWPHETSYHPLSAWVALCDVPVERGCMSFIPGSQQYTDLHEQDLTNSTSLFETCPDLVWQPRVTLPIRAGDCTFHHGRTAHMAMSNDTDEPRIAHVIIYMDATTTYAPKPHPVTDQLGLQPDALLNGELFPKLT